MRGTQSAQEAEGRALLAAATPPSRRATPFITHYYYYATTCHIIISHASIRAAFTADAMLADAAAIALFTPPRRHDEPP